jgi:hypothetical protein
MLARIAYFVEKRVTWSRAKSKFPIVETDA